LGGCINEIHVAAASGANVGVAQAWAFAYRHIAKHDVYIRIIRGTTSVMICVRKTVVRSSKKGEYGSGLKKNQLR
jgi:hypothetical protein